MCKTQPLYSTQQDAQCDTNDLDNCTNAAVCQLSTASTASTGIQILDGTKTATSATQTHPDGWCAASCEAGPPHVRDENKENDRFVARKSIRVNKLSTSSLISPRPQPHCHSRHSVMHGSEMPARKPRVPILSKQSRKPQHRVDHPPLAVHPSSVLSGRLASKPVGHCVPTMHPDPTPDKPPQSAEAKAISITIPPVNVLSCSPAHSVSAYASASPSQPTVSAYFLPERSRHSAQSINPSDASATLNPTDPDIGRAISTALRPLPSVNMMSSSPLSFHHLSCSNSSTTTALADSLQTASNGATAPDTSSVRAAPLRLSALALASVAHPQRSASSKSAREVEDFLSHHQALLDLEETEPPPNAKLLHESAFADLPSNSTNHVSPSLPPSLIASQTGLTMTSSMPSRRSGAVDAGLSSFKPATDALDTAARSSQPRSFIQLVPKRSGDHSRDLTNHSKVSTFTLTSAGDSEKTNRISLHRGQDGSAPPPPGHASDLSVVDIDLSSDDEWELDLNVNLKPAF